MKNNTLKRVLRYIKPYGKCVSASLFLALFCAAAQLVIPVFCGRAIDAMPEKGAVNMQKVFYGAGAVLISALLGAAAQQLQSVCNNRITFCVCRDLRNRLSMKINRLPLSYLDTHASGDTVSRMVADVDAFADGLLMGFTQLFTGVVTILATLGIMLFLNPVIAAAVVLLTPLSIFTARFIATRVHRFFSKQAIVRGRQTAFINEIVEGQRIVRAFGREQQCLFEFDEINKELEKASLNATFFSSLTNPSTRLVNNIVYATVAAASSFFAIGGGITVGQLSVFLSYASQYAKPFNEISGVVTELQNALTCADRIFEILDEKEETPDPENPLSPKAEGEVSLQNVRFGYSPDRPLIKNLCMEAHRGQKIAIVGPTGCGKTTLINLLMRFYETDGGKIEVDGADIRKMTRRDLRARYAMVLQDTWLHKGTVRENIAYAKPDATAQEVENAAKAAYAHSFITRLQNGYDTVIEEGGENLSSGQRQLLCIARAMLALPPMLILDEATSSIDTRTEQKIQAAFTKMMQGRTSFVVAHRLSTIREADLILVMNHGDIVEKGTHSELLQKNGFYRKIYDSQFIKT